MNAQQPERPEQELLAQLERTEARWSRIDMLLRRLAARLTYAAEGRTPQLDSTLGDIRRQVREPLAACRA